MGLHLESLTNAQRGCELAETGINLESFEVRYYPFFREILPNFQGEPRGFAMPDKLSRDVTINGETDGTTGVMAITFDTAFTPANDIDVFKAISAGSNAGGLYALEATESQSRDGWRSVSVSLQSHPLIT